MDLPRRRSYRILMTADTVGGVWDYALELTRTLGSYGCDVILAAMGAAPNAAQRATADQLENLLLCARACRLEWMQDPWREVDLAGAWLLDLEDSAAPDIVHLNSYAHGTLPWRTPTLMVGHSCVCSWFEAVRGKSPDGSWNEYRHRITRGLRAASLVTAPSQAMLDALERHYGGFAAAAPIYNGRCAGDFPPGVKEPLIFAAGRLWDDGKNLRLLESIAPNVSWPMYIAGEDRAPGAASPTRVSGAIHLGVLDRQEMSRWLGRAAIFVHPARYEPFGLAVLEAALAGCALVLGDIPSLREIWRDAALFVDPSDGAALRAALANLILSPDRRRALGRAGRERALQFSPTRMAEQYMQVYRRLVDQSHAAAGRPPRSSRPRRSSVGASAGESRSAE